MEISTCPNLGRRWVIVKMLGGEWRVVGGEWRVALHNSRPAIHNNRNTMRGPQCDDCFWDDGRMRLQREVKTLRHRGQHKGGFHRREIVADAHARAAAKREIGISGQPLGSVPGPAFRAKSERIVEPTGIAVRYPGAQNNRCAARNQKTANGGINRCQTPKSV